MSTIRYINSIRFIDSIRCTSCRDFALILTSTQTQPTCPAMSGLSKLDRMYPFYPFYGFYQIYRAYTISIESINSIYSTDCVRYTFCTGVRLYPHVHTDSTTMYGPYNLDLMYVFYLIYLVYIHNAVETASILLSISS